MKKVLIVGLGNVGNRFTSTRHNLGIETLRSWLEKQAEQATVKSWHEEPKWQAVIATAQSAENTVYCFFPLTMMNHSGQAVKSFLDATSLPVNQILIVHDDIEVPLGDIKLSNGGSAKGHNGVRSIHTVLGTTDIPRLRLGVGRPTENIPIEEFVLQPFTENEQAVIPALQARAHTAIDEWLQSTDAA